MKRYNGQSEVAGGYYFNPKSWSIGVVSGERGRLDGARDDEYLRVPLVLVLPLALALSGLFVVFLPVIGFALVGHTLARRAMGAGKAALEHGMSTLTPAMQVGEAHLTGKEPELREGHVEDESLSELKDEIARRRDADDDAAKR